MGPELLIPILLAAGGAAVIFSARRRKQEPAPNPVVSAPPVEVPLPPEVTALQGDLLQLRFDAHVAGLSAAREPLDTALDRLFEVAARIRDGGNVIEALRETIHHRLRPAALKNDATAVLAAQGPLEEVVLLLTLARDPVDGTRTRVVANTLRTIRDLPAPDPKPRALDKLVPGDALRIEGKPYLVMERHRYREHYEGRSWTWHELRLHDIRAAATVGLDLEEDDELEAWLQTQQLRLDDLGIEPRALERFDDEEAGSITVGGLRFRYSDSGEARYYRDEGSEADPFRYWEFESPSGRESIAVEAWDGARYEAFRMRKIEPLDIEPLPLMRRSS